MTTTEARARLQVAGAQIAKAVQGLNVAELQRCFAEHDDAIAALEAAVRAETTLACLAPRPDRAGNA